MTKEQVIILALSIALIAAIVAIVCLAILLNLNKKAEDTAKKVKIKNGVRYSKNEKIVDGQAVNITHLEGDIVLSVNKTYKVEKNGKLLPGTYTVLAASEKTDTFKLRLGGLVREYKHGDTIVLGDGDEICAVSASVILR